MLRLPRRIYPKSYGVLFHKGLRRTSPAGPHPVRMRCADPQQEETARKALPYQQQRQFAATSARVTQRRSRDEFAISTK